MIPQRIQRKSAKGWKKPGGAVYVGGGSKWGNPHIVRRDGGFIWVEGGGHLVCSTDREGNLRERRQEAVDLYRKNWIPLVDLDDLRADLAGKDLMCWCPLDQPCHADVLLELANGDRLPEGTPILFWPGARVGEGRRSITRTPIFKMGDGTEVVSVEGYPGGIALTHIQTLPEGVTITGLDQTPSTTPEARCKPCTVTHARTMACQSIRWRLTGHRPPVGVIPRPDPNEPRTEAHSAGTE